jgi:membrane protein
VNGPPPGPGEGEPPPGPGEATPGPTQGAPGPTQGAPGRGEAGPRTRHAVPLRTTELAARLEQLRARVEGTTAGRVQRRVAELDLIHQAMVLAALTMTLLIPALITLGAVIPLGDPTGVVPLVARRLGLSAQATRDFQSLFAGPKVVRSSSSGVSAVITLLSAYAWPTALQKGYQLAWHLPSRGLRDIWRPLLWLGVLLGAVATLALVGGILRGSTLPGGTWLVPVLLAPGVFLWAWWTQHLLLGGRVGWRPLLAGAITIAMGLFALRTGAQLSLSPSISENYDRYGPIGIVFVLLSWFIGFGVVMLGGAVVGAELWEVREHRRDAEEQRAAEAAGEAPPPPRPS